MEILFSKVSRKVPSKLPNDTEPCKNKKSKFSNTEASVFETQTLPSTDKTVRKEVTCKKKTNQPLSITTNYSFSWPRRFNYSAYSDEHLNFS